MTQVTTEFETRWWHKAEDDPSKVVCTLCPRECHIKQGSRGFCFVRANVEGELVLTTYGRSSGFCIDPIEKKPLNHFLPGTPILSLGTAGCNLGCKFCQNWDISKSREMDTVAGQAGPDAIVQAAKEYGCRSIAFTYNDPTIWAEYAIDTAKAARKEGIKTVAVTAGYISTEPRKEFYKWMDAANVDLKAFEEVFYRKLTQTHLEPVLDTLKYLKHETDVWFEITNLMIPTENDSPDETRRMCDWIVKELGTDVPVHFTAFHPDFKMRDLPRTPHETLVTARKIALETGLQYAYVGNVNDRNNQSTYCHSCGELVIGRDWYELDTYDLRGSSCKHCNTNIPGVFDADSEIAGQWGRKRQPIRISDPTQYISISTSALDEKLSDPDQGQPDPMKRVADAQDSQSEQSPKLDFNDEDVQTLLAYARDQVQIAVAGQTDGVKLPDEIAGAPAWGIFVTLSRGGGLRACRGRWGESTTVGELLQQVARDTAVNDQRFPAITKQELGRLTLDISLMHSPEPLSQKGRSLLDVVEVGKHGLVLTHPNGRGLLLPNVPVENGWNTHEYLCQLCVKSNLPRETWLNDANVSVLAFQTRLLKSEAAEPDFDINQLTISRRAQLQSLAISVVAGTQQPTIEDEVLTQPINQEMGLQLIANENAFGTTIGAGHSLVELTQMAGQSLRSFCQQNNRSQVQLLGYAVLHQSTRLRAHDYPNRHKLLFGQSILAESESRWSLQVPQNNQQQDLVGSAMNAADFTHQQWFHAQEKEQPKPRVTAFMTMFHNSRYQPGSAGHRQPARAGQFFPADVNTFQKMIEQHMQQAGDVERKPVRAVMLPHAGWVFCGKTMAKTLAHVEVPDRVIVVGPKHTPQGAAWSVAPHQSWDLPGMSIPIDVEMVSSLLDRLPSLKCEAEAHQMEHAVEVILPFLQKVNPNVRVTPMVIGECSFEQSQLIGNAIREAVSNSDEPVLLVISSDMNHFATEEVSHQLDKKALDAMQTGDARALFEICMANQISMCGMRPAAAIMHAVSGGDATAISPELIHYTTSAEASGDASRVVGYAGVLIA